MQYEFFSHSCRPYGDLKLLIFFVIWSLWWRVVSLVVKLHLISYTLQIYKCNISREPTANAEHRLFVTKVYLYCMHYIQHIIFILFKAISFQTLWYWFVLFLKSWVICWNPSNSFNKKRENSWEIGQIELKAWYCI